MKPTTLLLAASLVANVALVAVFARRTAAPSSAALGSASGAAPMISPASASSATAASANERDDARDLALGRAFARFQQKILAARVASPTAGDGRWWRNRSVTRTREEELLARRELSAALIAAFGDDLGIGGAESAQLAFLSPEKRAVLRSITQDYDEMMAKFGAGGGVQLASDREKLKLLRAERDRDIAALLTPAELADYELRTSASAAAVRSRYGDAIESEEDFKKLFALQKAFDEKFPLDALTGRVTPETMRARSDAQRQMQDDIRAALGEEKYAALRRANDPELRTLDSLVARLSLPATTTDRVAASRESYAAESQRINADPALSVPQRQAQLRDLGARARTDLATTLGTEAADAFAPRASWVGMLQGGLAFSTTPPVNSPGGLSLGGGTQSVYPVMPAGTPGSAGPRPVVNFVSATTDGGDHAPAGGTFFLGGAPGDPSAPRTMQVISVGTSSSTSTTTVPPADTTTPAPAPKK